MPGITNSKKRRRTKAEIEAEKEAEEELQSKIEDTMRRSTVYFVYCELKEEGRRTRHNVLVHESGAVFFPHHGMATISVMVAEHDLKNTRWCTGCYWVAKYLKGLTADKNRSFNWRSQEEWKKFIKDKDSRAWIVTTQNLRNVRSRRTAESPPSPFQESLHLRIGMVTALKETRIREKITRVAKRLKEQGVSQSTRYSTTSVL